MSNTTVSEQLQQMWRTRPYRLPQRGHIAGVAAGIGYRYGVDPVLIRVALVVGTIFGGAGIVLYLAAWLLLSKPGDSASAAQSLVGKGTSTKTIVLVVALIIAVTTIGPTGFGLDGSGLVSTLALLGGLWLLHQRRPEPPEFLPDGSTTYPLGGASAYPQSTFPISFDTPYNASSQPNSWGAAQYRPPQYDAGRGGYTPYTTLPKSYVPTPPPATGVDLTKSTPPQNLSEPPIPPSWDPLGVAPFAWDLPEPAAATAPEIIEKKKHSRWTSSFIGLALLAAALTGAIAASSESMWLTPARIAAVALAVVATGLILGAFLRKGYGLLIVTGPLVAFVVFASIIGPISFDTQYAGQQQYRPTTMADLQSEYTVQGGDLQLDLRGLDLTEDRTISVDVTAGNATISVPDGMNIRTDCTSVAASTKCGPTGVQQGNSPDNTSILTIEGSARAGNLEVLRG
ncbi:MULTISPECIES: PspC domain-containing protein [unclassified Rhodococcus (in: high G+C Gram-positive bacteria)]|uniref:PspC domain-containing protein n=1 Tax=unclassified Rhodococcus (in: high G+C Gram-positive bacteria) TaxID=192944 RepID=UPI001FF75DA6|nr:MULTISPECIES: PspC domain-containing protein [unclassified Rhodococcus (in: high G+C Gram-positive bacteria)]